MRELKKIVQSETSFLTSLHSALGIVIGFVSVFIAIKLQFDLHTLEHKYAANDDNTSGYLIVNKDIGILNTLNVASSDFGEEEINRIKSSDLIKDAAGFTSNNYRVTASSDKIYFRTELFFESIPNKYIDCSTDDFNWKKGDVVIPIIISNNFFNLYNYGFAGSQGLPKVPKSLLKEFEIKLQLRSKGKQENLKGRIVGFSDRINSVLVPEEFMTWSNQHFGEVKSNFSRIALHVNDLSNPDLSTWLNKNSLTVNKELLLNKVTKRLTHLFTSISGIEGVMIFILSISVLMLGLKLSMSQSKENITLLLLLGYRISDLINVYYKKFLTSFLISTSVAIVSFILISLMINTEYLKLGLIIYDFRILEQAIIFIGLIVSVLLLAKLNISQFVKGLF